MFYSVLDTSDANYDATGMTHECETGGKNHDDIKMRTGKQNKTKKETF